MRTVKTVRSKMRKFKLRRLKVRRLEMKSNIGSRVNKALTSVMVMGVR